jgi:purine nucleoside phosphorylase
LTPHAEEITGDHPCGFPCNRSTTDHIFCIRQIIGRPREHNVAVNQLFIDFKRTYDPFRREVLYNILIEFGISMKLARLTKMCLNETDSRVRAGKHLSNMFPI